MLYRKRRKFYFMLIIPAFLLYGIALLLPLFGGTIPYSFLNWNLMSGSKSFAGIGNYVKLLSDTTFWTAFLFNIKVGLATIIGSNILAFAIALVLNRNIHGKGVIRSAFFIPNIMSAVLVAYVWSLIFSQILPLLAEQMAWAWLSSISWFGTPGMATFTIIVVSIWQGVGFLMLIYTAGLQSIPTDVIEAARIDGCGGIRMITNVQLPLLMPTITINLFVSIASAFKSYDIPNALTTGGPYGSTRPIAMNIYQEAFVKYNLGYGSAKSVVLFLTVAVITIIQLHFTRKKEVEY